MIQDSGKHTSRFSLLSFETTSNETEDLISSIGYQDVGPRQEYPARVIPKRYSFNDGRQLAEFQLVYITGGTGVFEDNESSRIVTPGTLFLLRPGYWHSYHPNRDTGWTEYYIGFNGPTFRREIERFFGERKGPIDLGMSATLVDLFEQALFYSERQCSQTMSILQAVVIHMLALVNYNLTTRDKTDDKLDAAINYVKKYMADHLSEPIDVPALAAERGMSYTWLRRMFRKNTGMAPAQYLQQLRIHMSMYLLRNTSLQIKNVAVDSGFKTSEYFCSVFQETVGMTPRAYRAANNDGARQPETDATKRGA